MTNILAIDTSGEACSVALSVKGEVAEIFEVIPRLHARKLLPMVQSILAESELTLSSLNAIAFGRGPGSFTGLRICAGVAQGLAFGADLPTLPVSSLAALAQGVYRAHGAEQIMTLLDARMDELYFGCYEIKQGLACLLEEQGEDWLLSPQQLNELVGLLPVPDAWLGVGDGWRFTNQFADFFQQVTVIEEPVYPHAQDILTLAHDAFKKGLQVPAEQALPVYLRDKTAWRRINAQ